MATIDTKVGNLDIPAGTNLAPVSLSNDDFQSVLRSEMNSAQSKLIDGSISLARVFYLSKEGLMTLLNGGGYALIFYHTASNNDLTTTFTVISADESLNPMIDTNDMKWKLTTRHGVQLGALSSMSWQTKDLFLDSIYNFGLSVHSHELETGDFLGKLAANNNNLIENIKEGALPVLRIAAVLKEDLQAYAPYDGVLIYLNYAAEKRLAPIIDNSDIDRPEKKQFASLTFLGVKKIDNTLIISAEEVDQRISLRGFCPPDCHIYNNN